MTPNSGELKNQPLQRQTKVRPKGPIVSDEATVLIILE